jgi:glycosyltransferase involved in cell wall biosynthesis
MSYVMKKSYDISIIVCCYGGEETIEGCLNSLKYQKRDDISIEVLLIDDGSKDGTSKKIFNFLENNSDLGNLQFNYFRKENEGLSIARNFGIRKSNSSIVAFIDEDAEADENFAKNIITGFNSNTHINCIGGNVLLKNTENSFAQIIQKSIFSLYMKTPNTFIGTNMAFRKEFLIAVGGFQPEFIYRGDETLLKTKSKENISILISENIIVKHPQPSTLKKWLTAKYQSGYFSAAINDFIKLKDIMHYRRIIVALITLSTPLFVLLFFILNSNISYILLILFVLFLISRFILNNSINNVIIEYYNNSQEIKKLSKSHYIRYIVVLGYIYSDFGYLKGVFVFHKYVWKTLKNPELIEY